MYIKMFKLNEKGQALLIVVLVMVVALTVGLSIASKTITNLRTSTEEANSQKALAAAEAGIEQSLKTNQIASGTFTDTQTSYQTSVTQVLGTSFLMNGGNPVLSDNGSDIWLSDYSSDPTQLYTNNRYTGTLTIKWGFSTDPCTNAALETVILSGTRNSPVSNRYVFDPCASRASGNRFTQVGLTRSSLSGKEFFYQAQVGVSSGLIGRIIPIYYNTPIAIVGSVALPPQGTIITSTGCVPSCITGSVQRKVNVFQGYPEIPSEFFPYNLFSPQ